ncbi:hypothetical protein [Streptomyces griseorubiginosus]|uniref:hypothetical protein n=1 Tax=Streptomyces griseorubiginosus TaxID=67304 RepID=UPI0011402FDB|nr:hypothetical protein [Streptomyces griseorubiginosus]
MSRCLAGDHAAVLPEQSPAKAVPSVLATDRATPVPVRVMPDSVLAVRESLLRFMEPVSQSQRLRGQVGVG